MTTKPAGVWKVPVIDLKATGENITSLRKKTGISVKEIQMVMGFTNPQAIYKWQNGDSLPSVDNLVILAAVLGVTIDEILVTDGDEAGDGKNEQEGLVILQAELMTCLHVVDGAQ